MSDVSPRRQALGFAGLLIALGVLGTAVLAAQFNGRIEAPPRAADASAPRDASPLAEPDGPIGP
jgi:hypothetical protein